MVAQLLELWPQRAIGTRRIGEIIGVSKNAIVGKASRMWLPLRASDQTIERARRLTSPISRPGGFDPHAYAESFKPGECRYLDGDDPRRYTVCGEPVVEGKSYCAEHASRLFVKQRDKPLVDKGHYR